MNIGKLLQIVINRWYYFYVASAITLMFNVRDWRSLLVVITAIAGVKSLSSVRWNVVDVLVLLAMLYGLISFFFSDYKVELFYYGIKYQWASMFFYFIARNKALHGENFIDNFKWPMFIVIIAGIILYFFPPSWYLDFRYSNILSEEGSISYFEKARMSSFFPHPYFLGYGSCFFIIYIIKQMLINKTRNNSHYIMLFLAMFTLVFAQMRIAIAYTFVFLILLIAYNVFIGKRKSGFVKFLAIMMTIGIILYFTLETVIDESFLEYINQRTIEKEGNLVEERFQMFSYFTQYISLLGYGLGRFGHAALTFNLPSCADNDYIRLLAEQGYIGTFLILFPMIYAIVNGIKHYKNTFFETNTLLFYPFAMLGATPTESWSQHTFMLWFCIGHIISKTQNDVHSSYYSKL